MKLRVCHRPVANGPETKGLHTRKKGNMAVNGGSGAEQNLGTKRHMDTLSGLREQEGSVFQHGPGVPARKCWWHVLFVE